MTTRVAEKLPIYPIFPIFLDFIQMSCVDRLRRRRFRCPGVLTVPKSQDCHTRRNQPTPTQVDPGCGQRTGVFSTVRPIATKHGLVS